MGIFLAYALLAALMTWPLVIQLDSHLPGSGDDLLVHYWNGWRTGRVLAQGGDLFHTDLIFYPTGVSLLYHNVSWFNVALWLPLEPLLGGIAAFNLVYLLNLVLCALGMYALARYLTHSPAAAFIAGLVYAFWPYRLFEIDHPNLITTQWLPLFLLYLMRIVREKERRFQHAAVAALFLALTGYARWQLLVFAAFVGGAYGLYSLWFERQSWDLRVVAAFLMTGIVSLALMAPPLYPLVRGQLTRAHPEDLFASSLVAKQTDLLAYVIPPHHHLLEGLFEGLEYTEGYTRAWYSNAYLGYLVILLVVLGLLRAGQRAWLWMGLALVVWLLALGPALRINKHIYEGIPLPYVLVKDFLPIKIMREERRFNVLLALPIAAMVAHGVAFLRDWVRANLGLPAWATPILFAGLVLLIGLDYLQIPVPTFDTEISPFYRTLAEEPDPVALLNLPTGRDRSPFFMLCQTIHGKPIVEGSVARPPREAKAFGEENPFLLYLRENRRMNPELPDVSRQLAVLAEAGIRYLIINEQYAFPWEKANWRTYLAYEPVYEDGFIQVYRTDPRAGRDFDVSQRLHDGIGLTQIISTTEAIAPGSRMEVAVVWGTMGAQEAWNEDFEVELALMDGGGWPQQSVTFQPVANWPTGQWPPNALGHGRYAFEVDPRLPGGVYSLTLALVEPGTQKRVGRAVVIRDGLEMPIPPRVFAPPPMQREVEATFGDDLSLLGYDLDQGGGELRITLHWQALRRMDRSYKFFVHLYDAGDDNALVVQADVVPRGWTYPTTWWEAGEIVSDQVHLSLGETPAGEYRLAVGVYHPGSGDRLPVSAPTLTTLSEALILQELEVNGP